ncbi:hypothetical protein pclt_cds_167 [Pandoravirus celtis]|uniref:Uncharacterized protein n=1 Tax=Pandoravirus celtis TaxID=2568002 RepID=A0A4D6EFZ1_9VIRU|nr:hypothetical protein pclt_cds_167 [Pandoravirus celtis]
MEPPVSVPRKCAQEAQAEDTPTHGVQLSRQQRALQEHGKGQVAGDQDEQGPCDDDDGDDDDLCIWAEDDGIRYAHLRLDTGDDLKMPVVTYDF